ncbi:MAG TPA: SRPBCC domain-containing protein [Mycobacteriales bacterium]
MSAPVLASVHVRRSPVDAFRVFTDRIGDWWPLSTHGCFGSRAVGLRFDDGRLVERSADGDAEVWGEVLAWEPPRRFAVTWHPGRSAGPHTVVSVEFLADEDGTRVELTHSGWEAYGDRAAAARAPYEGPDAWGHVLGLFRTAAEG